MQLNFDASQYEPNEPRDYALLKNGWYTAIVDETDYLLNQSGSGRYLKIQFTLQRWADAIPQPADATECANRKIWANLNLEHTNPTAVEIARGDLSAICSALGLSYIQHTEQLHGKPLDILVGTETRKDTGEQQNRITGYRACQGMPQPTAATPMTGGPAVPPNHPNAAPVLQQQPAMTNAPPPAAMPPAAASFPSQAQQQLQANPVGPASMPGAVPPAFQSSR